MKQYLNLLRHTIETGTTGENRTDTAAIAVFGEQFKHDMRNGFPLLTTKKVHFKSIVYELLWFISGATNIKFLTDNNVRIWNEWADENGDLGPVYGKQWRDRGGIDQLQRCIDELKVNPTNRRLIVDSWDPALLPDNDKSFTENVKAGKQALPPCHFMYQFNSDGEYLDIRWDQRSVDIGLGLPFNIASYGLLLLLVAQVTGLKPRYLVGSLGNCHVYSNHVEKLTEQLDRPLCYDLPTVELNEDINCIDDFTADDITLVAYVSHPGISLKVAV